MNNKSMSQIAFLGNKNSSEVFTLSVREQLYLYILFFLHISLKIFDVCVDKVCKYLDKLEVCVHIYTTNKIYKYIFIYLICSFV